MTSLLVLALLTQVPQPKLYVTQPSGAKAGSSVELRLVAGAELERVDRLIFSHPGITAAPVLRPADRLVPAVRPVENTFTVTVAADVPPGIYELRAGGPYGVSNARRFAVGDRMEAAEKEPNDTEAQAPEIALGTTVSGTCDPQKFDLFRVALKKGQRLLVEGASFRLLSRAQLVLSLSDPSGRLLRRAAGTRSSDPLLDVTADVDGLHLLQVAEQTYKGGDEYFYRVTVGTGPWVDFAEPPVLKPGIETAVTLFGRNLPGGQPAGIDLDGRPLEKIQATVKAPANADERSIEAFILPGDASADVFTWRWMSTSGASNAVRFLLAEGATTAEVEPNDDPAKAAPLALPAQVAGKLDRRGDRDWYEFKAKKGDKLWIEVTSQRLGLPSDPTLVLQQVTATGVKDLLESDDPGGPQQQQDMRKRYRLTPDDPGVLWTSPDEGTYRLLVRDLYGDAQGDARFAYVLTIRPAKPDFRLIAFPVEAFPPENKATPWSCVLRGGGVERIRVYATRLEGFDGEIRLEAEGLPPGVTAAPAFLRAGDTQEDLLLQAAADAPTFAGTLRITGKAAEVSHTARSAELVWPVTDQNTTPFVPRVTDRIGLAVDAERKAPFTVLLGTPGKTVKTARGAKLKLPVKLVKNADYKDLAAAKVTLKPEGLPGPNNQKTMTAKDLVLDAGKLEGEIEIDITDKAPLGIVPVFLSGDVQISYVHEPNRAKAVEEERKRVDGVAKAAAEEAKTAEAARGKADADLAKAAKDVEELKKKLGATAADAADKAKLEASLKEAEERRKAAEEAKAKAGEVETKAKDLAKAAGEMLKKLADDAKKATDMAKEKKVKIGATSLPAMIEIAAAPVSVKAPAATSVKAEGQAELTIEIERVAGFEEEIVFELAAPAAAKLTLAEPAKAAKDAAKLTLKVAAGKGAAEGTHAATLKAQLKWNGKTLPFEQALSIKVDKADPPPAPKEEPKKDEPKKDAPKEPTKP